jgi:hypothetical protein
LTASSGRNGEGDRYYTYGEIDVAWLITDGDRQTEPLVTLPPPPMIALKHQLWHNVSDVWLVRPLDIAIDGGRRATRVRSPSLAQVFGLAVLAAGDNVRGTFLS